MASQLAIESCGLEPIGTVIGCTARRLNWGEFGLGEVGCGYVSPRSQRSKYVQSTSYLAPSGTTQIDNQYGHIGAQLGLTSPTMRAISPGDTASSDHVVYIAAPRAAWDAAIARMLQETKALGADGVVSVELTEQDGKGGVREFVVTGTAVRSKGPTHRSRPFTTTLSGNDVAKLIAAGWMPASIVMGLSVAIRHDTTGARLARARVTSPREIVGISELVHAARKHARQQLESRTREIGASGAVLTSQMTLSIEERRVNLNHHDIVAEASATATAIVEIGSSDAPRTRSASVIALTC